MIALDLPGGVVELRDEDVVRLREACGGRGWSLLGGRDLALLLD